MILTSGDLFHPYVLNWISWPIWRSSNPQIHSSYQIANQYSHLCSLENEQELFIWASCLGANSIKSPNNAALGKHASVRENRKLLVGLFLLMAVLGKEYEAMCSTLKVCKIAERERSRRIFLFVFKKKYLWHKVSGDSGIPPNSLFRIELYVKKFEKFFELVWQNFDNNFYLCFI